MPHVQRALAPHYGPWRTFAYVYMPLLNFNPILWQLARVLRSICLPLLGTLPLAAHATLGDAPFGAGAPGGPDARIARYQAVQLAQGYRLHGIELSNGIVVQEFADTTGRVFAVRWTGPDLPDLALLLGKYLPVFKAAVQAARQAGKRGGPVSIQADGLVLVSTGAMGTFQGYAYVDALRPPGVDLQPLLR